MGTWNIRYTKPYGELIRTAGQKVSSSITRMLSDRTSNSIPPDVREQVSA